MQVDREQVVAFRVAAQEFGRDREDLAVLTVGVQDTPYGSARAALAARTPVVDDSSLLLAWATRGAPHLHRADDLPGLAAALWPVSDADATARINVTAIKEGARLGVEAFTATARAMREVVTDRMPKGEVSAGVSALVPPSLTYWCKVCEARHISGGLFQQAGLFAGVRLEIVGGKTFLAPVPGERPPVPSEPGDLARIARAYLRLLGPAGPAEVASFIGTRQAEVRRAWPADLVEVRVGTRTAWITPDALETLESAPAPDLLRLLPPSDPYLQARDREVIVPDEARRKEVWRILGNPGAVLLDGEVVGVWRTRKKAKALEVAVTLFEPLRPAARALLDAEAGRLAGVRGLPAAEVRVAE